MEEKNSQKAYERVFDYFTAEITSGNLRLNDKVPTERALSGPYHSGAIQREKRFMFSR